MPLIIPKDILRFNTNKCISDKRIQKAKNLLFFLTITILLIFSSYAYSLEFVKAGEYALPAKPISLVSADFDGDGNLDLAVINLRSRESETAGESFYLSKKKSSLCIFSGDGSGGFKRVRKYITGINSVDICTGDFNGDKIPDIAVANAGKTRFIHGEQPKVVASDSVSIFYGKDKSSNFKKRIIKKTVRLPMRVKATDINSDGRDELIILGNRDNNLRDGEYYNTKTTIFDGKKFKILKSFMVLNTGFNPSPIRSLSLETGDFDNDNDIDLIVTKMAGDYHFVNLINQKNKKTGDKKISFTRYKLKATKNSPHQGASVSGDFNNDGFLDVAVIPGSSTLGAIYFRQIDGTYSYSFFLDDYGAGVGEFDFFKLTAVDLNKDNNLDLVIPGKYSLKDSQTIATTENVLVILLGDGTGNFAEPLTFDVGKDPRAVVAGDFNGDDKPDLAVVNREDNTLMILLQAN